MTGRGIGRALAAAVLAGASGCRPVQYDLVLVGGRVVDGTGNSWFYGDVAVRGVRIARVAPAGALATASARRRIAVGGLVVAPGFIDIIGQSRNAALRGDGRMVSKVTQGVTTEIMGEGITDAPVNDRTQSQFGAGRGTHGFGRWLEAMQAHGLSVNVGSFLGATTVRRYAMGGAQRPPSPAELDTMRQVVRRAMEDGALGVATALIYPPGSFASTQELIELAKAAAAYGGVYATHLRSEGGALLESIDEALEIGRLGGVPVEIYHLKAAGRNNWHKAALAACLPPWASADQKLLDNLGDSTTRARIHGDMLDERSAEENICRLATPSGVIVDGMTLSAIAERERKDWADAVIDLVLEQRHGLRGILSLASDEALALEIRQPWIKFGTDAAALDPASAPTAVHPRAYGTYPHILSRFVRQDRALSLEEAVRKMTSAVASRLSIPDRGLLREGMYADIVVFDPVMVADHATYADPQRLSTGVQYVFVNGVEVVHSGAHTGAKPGRVVRGPGWSR